MIKRLFDIVVSLLLIIMLWPLLVTLAVAVSVSSPGPIFFRQTRVGRHEKPFSILKFRSMKVGQTGLKITAQNDPRITPLGKIIRETKLDELPQLFNVLKGDMSLVGPRPEVPEYIQYYPDDVRQKIFSMRPGITDLASLAYKDEERILAEASDPQKAYIEKVMPDKLEYCMEYIRNYSFLLDLKILFRTLMVALR
jgi:lipopolysaccharide/colanic/teichoic acid biosynthesis glycosyltransferase